MPADLPAGIVGGGIGWFGGPHLLALIDGMIVVFCSTRHADYRSFSNMSITNTLKPVSTKGVRWTCWWRCKTRRFYGTIRDDARAGSPWLQVPEWAGRTAALAVGRNGAAAAALRSRRWRLRKTLPPAAA